MKPIVQAFILADHIYQDVTTGKIIIAGCFTNIIRLEREKKAEDLPGPMTPYVRAGSPYAYVNLLNVRHSMELELRWVQLSDNRVLFKIGCKIESKPDPLQHIELIVPLPELPMPEPGVYALELLTDDTPLAYWRVTQVLKSQEPEE